MFNKAAALNNPIMFHAYVYTYIYLWPSCTLAHFFDD